MAFWIVVEMALHDDGHAGVLVVFVKNAVESGIHHHEISQSVSLMKSS